MECSVAQTLMDEFPCRNTEIKQLLQVQVLPNHIILHAPPGTGRTAILRKSLELQQKDYIFIDCKECYTSQVFYSKLLRTLFGTMKPNFRKVHSLSECVHIFSRATVRKRKLRYIILKNFEVLPKEKSALLAFHKMLLANGWRFYFVLITSSWTAVADLLCLTCIPTVCFPSYTQDQLMVILSHLRKSKYDEHLFLNFLRAFVPVANLSYSNIGDFTRLADDLFPLYKKPVEENRLRAEDVADLYRNINRRLQKLNADLINVYVHLDCDEDEKMPAIELPMSTKMLLIAAYIASNIPAKEDQKLFCRRSLKKKKRAVVRKSGKVDTSKGPKSFPLDRLMAIYFALNAEKPCISTNLLTQVGTLVDLQLLKLVGEGNLDAPTYKCYADSDLVDAIAKSVEVDVHKYVQK